MIEISTPASLVFLTRPQNYQKAKKIISRDKDNTKLHNLIVRTRIIKWILP